MKNKRRRNIIYLALASLLIILSSYVLIDTTTGILQISGSTEDYWILFLDLFRLLAFSYVLLIGIGLFVNEIKEMKKEVSEKDV